jgi:squalene-associated FAD-dependent desaturase
MSPPRIAVIGGGLAGMSAALAAADAGSQVTLFERRSRLGGLTWSFERQGRWFDNGQHVFLRCCAAYRQFLDRIGGSEQVVLQSRLDVPVLGKGGVRSSIRRTGLPAPLHLAGSLLRYRHLTWRQRVALGRPVLALRRLDPEDPALDTVTFGEWLGRHGQDRQAIEHLWDLIALPTLNVPASEASLALAVRVFRTGLLDRADGGDIGWSAVPLRQLHAVNGAAALDRAGVELRLGTRVHQVAPATDGGWVVGTSDGPVAADGAIIAAPPEVTAELAPPGCVPPLEGLGTSPIVNVHLVLDRPVIDVPLLACVDSPIQFLFDTTASSGTKSGQCLAISLSAADGYIGLHPRQLVETFRQALDDLVPRARHAQLVDAAVSKEHGATFRAVPGTAALRPPARTAREGLALAGAWCDTGWPATMEGAVLSGQSAAQAVATDVGNVPRSPVAVLERGGQ